MFVNISPVDYNTDETVVSLVWVLIKVFISTAIDQKCTWNLQNTHILLDRRVISKWITISLPGLSRYASRVKLITNAASKNADNKEIVRLKGIIAKLKKEEEVEVDEEVWGEAG